MTALAGRIRKELQTLFIRTLFGLLLLGFCGLDTLAAYQEKTPAAQFDQSLILYRNQRYDEALTMLKGLTDTGTPHQHMSRALLLHMRTLEKMGKWQQAESLADRFIMEFPRSRYLDDVHLLKSRLAGHNGDRIGTLRHLLWIMDHSENSDLVAIAEDRITGQLNSKVTRSAWHTLASEEHTSATAIWIKLWSARANLGWQCKSEAERLMRELNGSTLSDKQLRLLQAWQGKEAGSLEYPTRIGLVLPLSGDNGAEGHEFLQGFIFALAEKKTAVELVLQDSKSSLIEAAKAIRPLLKADVDVIIGDLDGGRSAALAALAVQAGITYLCPVATDIGIAGLGEQVFQMNSDLETRGEALARYAYDKMGLRTFASLAPADGYGQLLTDAFTATIDKLGGTIIAQQWYYPGTEDFKRHFQTIRATALATAPPDTAVLNAFSRRKKEMAETGQRTLGSQDDEFEIPVRSIDGFFFPIYEEDIAIIAPQFALVNLQSTLLGGDYWYHPDILRSQRRYVNGVVFFSGYYVNETNMEYIDFRNRYRIITAQSPSALSVMGYDLGNQLDRIKKAGQLQDGRIADFMQNGTTFQGVAGTCRFSADVHVNRMVHLLQYKDGNITKLEP